jgi:hypothetical protein
LEIRIWEQNLNQKYINFLPIGGTLKYFAYGEQTLNQKYINFLLIGETLEGFAYEDNSLTIHTAKLEK